MPHFLAKCKFASLCGASAEICQALKNVLLFSINKYRDIRPIALPRILSCLLQALLSQVQVCILVAHQQSCRALNLYIVLDKHIYRDICLIALLSAFWKPAPHFLVKCRFLAHQQSPVKPSNKKGCSNYSDATKRRLEDGWPESMSSARRQVILASSLRKFL